MFGSDKSSLIVGPGASRSLLATTQPAGASCSTGGKTPIHRFLLTHHHEQRFAYTLQPVLAFFVLLHPVSFLSSEDCRPWFADLCSVGDGTTVKCPCPDEDCVDITCPIVPAGSSCRTLGNYHSFSPTLSIHSTVKNQLCVLCRRLQQRACA